MVGDIVATIDEMDDELIFKLKSSMVAADVNAHAQFNHGESIEKENPPHTGEVSGGFFSHEKEL